jgi:peptidoglycan/LPS O-acetylase OafA/YrhL
MTVTSASSAPAVDAKSVQRLRSVDALRAIAALMVVLRHSALGEGTRPGATQSILKSVAALGAEGVGLFLVISGFSIHLRWARGQTGFSPLAFWRRRFVRLYPTYYVALAAIIVATLVVLGTGGLEQDRAAHEASIFSLQVIHPPIWATVLTHATIVGANVFFVAMLPQAWSLALEEQIYALYTVLLRFVRELRPVRLAFGALALALTFNVVTSLLASPGIASGLIYTQVPARLFEWVLGLLAVEAFFGHVALPRVFHRLEVGFLSLAAAALCGLTSLGTLTVGSHRVVLTEIVYHPLAGLAFFIILNWAIRSEAALLAGRAHNVVRLLAWMGLFSYSIYLLHPAIMRLLGEYIPGRGVLRRAILWAAVIGGSWLFFKLVESHFIRRAQRTRPASARV